MRARLPRRRHERRPDCSVHVHRSAAEWRSSDWPSLSYCADHSSAHEREYAAWIAGELGDFLGTFVHLGGLTTAIVDALIRVWDPDLAPHIKLLVLERLPWPVIRALEASAVREAKR